MRLRQRIPLSLQFGALALLYLLAGASLAVVADAFADDSTIGPHPFVPACS